MCDAECLLLSAGKTTLLRDVVSLLANRFNKRVVVVDTSNEIGGDGAVPHECLGIARRMPVHDHSKQHEILLQAVQNHNPQVLHTALLHSCMFALSPHYLINSSLRLHDHIDVFFCFTYFMFSLKSMHGITCSHRQKHLQACKVGES